MAEFRFFLRPTYYRQGFFNVPVEVAHYFGGDGRKIAIELGSGGRRLIGTINRSANPNGAPRVMGGAQLRDWLQSTFHEGDRIAVDIRNPTRIRVREP